MRGRNPSSLPGLPDSTCKEVCESSSDFVTLGRKAGLGDKKVSSELDMLSSRCLWNTGGKECGWLELHGRGSLMSMYGACLETCGWNRT